MGRNGRAKIAASSPRGYARVELAEGAYRLRLGFSELADADEHLGRSLVGAITSDPMNFHLIRVAFYFGMRKVNKSLKLRSVRDAGQLLEGTPIEVLSEAISEALSAGGVIPKEEDDLEDMGIEDDQGVHAEGEA